MHRLQHLILPFSLSRMHARTHTHTHTHAHTNPQPTTQFNVQDAPHISSYASDITNRKQKLIIWYVTFQLVDWLNFGKLYMCFMMYLSLIICLASKHNHIVATVHRTHLFNAWVTFWLLVKISLKCNNIEKTSRFRKCDCISLYTSVLLAILYCFIV